MDFTWSWKINACIVQWPPQIKTWDRGQIVLKGTYYRAILRALEPELACSELGIMIKSAFYFIFLAFSLRWSCLCSILEELFSKQIVPLVVQTSKANAHRRKRKDLLWHTGCMWNQNTAWSPLLEISKVVRLIDKWNGKNVGDGVQKGKTWICLNKCKVRDI
jgi:hypothetical protein